MANLFKVLRELQNVSGTIESIEQRAGYIKKNFTAYDIGIKTEDGDVVTVQYFPGSNLFDIKDLIGEAIKFNERVSGCVFRDITQEIRINEKPKYSALFSVYSFNKILEMYADL